MRVLIRRQAKPVEAQGRHGDNWPAVVMASKEKPQTLKKVE
jgi:hypothetical protein